MMRGCDDGKLVLIDADREGARWRVESQGAEALIVELDHLTESLGLYREVGEEEVEGFKLSFQGPWEVWETLVSGEYEPEPLFREMVRWYTAAGQRAKHGFGGGRDG